MKSVKLKFPEKITAQDRAKLFIRDLHIHNDSDGKERLLTPNEEREIIKHAQKHNQIAEMNRIGKMFNQSLDYVRQMNIRYLLFTNAYKDFTSFLSTCLMSTVYKIKLDSLSFENKEVQDFLDEIETDEYFNVFSIMETSKNNLLRINPIPQRKFLDCVETVRNYEKMVFQISILSEKAGFCILSPRTEELIKGQREDIQEFTQHKGLIAIMDRLLFSRLAQSEKDPSCEKHSEEFTQSFFHTEEVMKLTEEEKENLRKEVSEDLSSLNR